MSLSRSNVLAALTRGYSTELNHAKPIDVNLVEAMLDEVMMALAVASAREEYLRKMGVSDDRHPTAS